MSGHLATLKGAGLTLRESAQCPKEDEKAFQDRECGMVHQSSSWDHTKHISWCFADSLMGVDHGFLGEKLNVAPFKYV